jgi:hypothetical protein
MTFEGCLVHMHTCKHVKFLAWASFLLLPLAAASFGQESAAGNRDKNWAKAQPIYITVRIRPDVMPETLKHLSQVTEPETVKVKSSSNLRTILKQFYGFTMETLRDLVEGANPTLYRKVGDPDSPRDVVLPPGVKGAVNVEIPPQNNLTLRELALIEMGSDGEKTRKAIEDANPSLRGSWNQPITQKVKLPYTINFASYQVKSRFIGDCEAIARKLAQRDPAVLSAQCSPGFGVVPHWNLAATPQQACPATEGGARWPFETLPKDWFQLNQDKRIGSAVVAIVDTGIPENDPRFELWSNPEPAQLMTIDRYSTQCVNDIHGCNFINPALFPVDDCQVPDDYNHGTHIAGLASARLWEAPEQINRRVQLMILKVADAKGQIEPSRVSNAIIYSERNHAAVVNMSLTGLPDTTITTFIRQFGSVLFVAAAGNPASGMGIDLDDDRLNPNAGFPAILGKVQENVISVAAHDGNGQLVCFSNYGKEAVQLAAPGYKLNSTVSNGQKKELNGTSQATALVTLTAALLYARGLTSPSAIKHRIIAATDFDPSLRDKVFSDGRLNIGKALDYYHDLIQYRTGDRKIIAGEIRSPLSISVNGETNDLKLRGEVYRIVMNYSTEPGKKIQVTALRQGKLVHFYADTIGQIQFESPQGPVTISSEEIAEIIPKQWGPVTNF